MLKRAFGLSLVAVAFGCAAAHADGCEDMKQLCKEATAKAEKCTKSEKDERACKPLIDVRDATCTQVDLVCKPAVPEPE